MHALCSPERRSVLLDVYLVFLWVMCGLVCDKRDRRVTEDGGSFSGPFESPAPALDCRSLYDCSPYSDDLMNAAASLAPPRSWVSGIERSPPFYGHFDSFTQSCLLYLHLLLFPFLLALSSSPPLSLCRPPKTAISLDSSRAPAWLLPLLTVGHLPKVFTAINIKNHIEAFRARRPACTVSRRCPRGRRGVWSHTGVRAGAARTLGMGVY